MSQVNVFLEVCKNNFKIPTYANNGDSGMDIYAAEDITIYPNQTLIIPTGLKFAIPIGYEIQVRPRSGLSYNTPLRISNSPGTIDSGYRNELGIIITNTSPEFMYKINNILNKCFNFIYKYVFFSKIKTFQLPIYGLKSTGNKKGIYEIKKGNRIAQIVLQSVPTMNFIIVNDVAKIGKNRNGGIGSTGI